MILKAHAGGGEPHQLHPSLDQIDGVHDGRPGKEPWLLKAGPEVSLLSTNGAFMVCSCNAQNGRLAPARGGEPSDCEVFQETQRRRDNRLGYVLRPRQEEHHREESRDFRADGKLCLPLSCFLLHLLGFPYPAIPLHGQRAYKSALGLGRMSAPVLRSDLSAVSASHTAVVGAPQGTCLHLVTVVIVNSEPSQQVPERAFQQSSSPPLADC